MSSDLIAFSWQNEQKGSVYIKLTLSNINQHIWYGLYADAEACIPVIFLCRPT